MPTGLCRTWAGDVDEAREVLRALTALLDELDDPAVDDSSLQDPPKMGRRGGAPSAP